MISNVIYISKSIPYNIYFNINHYKLIC